MGLQTVTLAYRKLAAVIEFANFVNGFCVLVVILQLFNRNPIAVYYWRRKRGYLCAISPYNPPKQIVLGGNESRTVALLLILTTDCVLSGPIRESPLSRYLPNAERLRVSALDPQPQRED